MLISDHLMQSLSDIMKSAATSSPVMICFSSPEMIARTLYQPPGKSAIIWRSSIAALAMFAS
jgi:hypothetical protein